MRFIHFCCVMTALLASGGAAAQNPAQTPVIFDTDIGTDIDDAYALAALMHRPELELLGVTVFSFVCTDRHRVDEHPILGSRVMECELYGAFSVDFAQ